MQPASVRTGVYVTFYFRVRLHLRVVSNDKFVATLADTQLCTDVRVVRKVLTTAR